MGRPLVLNVWKQRMSWKQQMSSNSNWTLSHPRLNPCSLENILGKKVSSWWKESCRVWRWCGEVLFNAELTHVVMVSFSFCRDAGLFNFASHSTVKLVWLHYISHLIFYPIPSTFFLKTEWTGAPARIWEFELVWHHSDLKSYHFHFSLKLSSQSRFERLKFLSLKISIVKCKKIQTSNLPDMNLKSTTSIRN